MVTEGFRMKYIKRFIQGIILIWTINAFLLSKLFSLGFWVEVCFWLLFLALFTLYNVRPERDKKLPKKLNSLICGYQILLATCICFIAELLLTVSLCIWGSALIDLSKWANIFILILNCIISFSLMTVLYINGLVRIFVTSGQLTLTLRILLVCLWWIPIANIVPIILTCKTVGTEIRFLRDKHFLNLERKNLEICRTKYPILLLHGIFFRDWKVLNYWGRIPGELLDNGAVIYYGNLSSSLSVEGSAEELKRRILEIVAETNCGKVNIIAHSKGGLDARYAISCLGMDSYVASLTTINTPHYGSSLASKLIEKTPEKLVFFIGKQYQTIFTRLGDKQVDFFSGIIGLTPERCAELNQTVTDREGVLYQSLGSKMRAPSGALFPLSLGYRIIYGMDGDNDGLVSTESMKWGRFLGMWTPSGQRGISHGDVVDLTRKNIEGFDVCERYVQLVSDLKEKGL